MEIKQVVKQLNDNIGRINERLQPYTYSLQHGVELLVEKPVGYRVRQAIATSSLDAATGQQGAAVTSLQVRELDGGGTLGITAYYDLRHTEPFYERSASLPQNVVRATLQTLVFDTLRDTRGSGISYNAGTFTLAEAGTYIIGAKIYWQSATYTQSELIINAAGRRYSDDYITNSTDGPIITAEATAKLAAGDTVTIQAFHNNAALVDRTANGDTTIGRATSVRITRLYNDSTPTYDVSMLLLD